MPRKVDSVQCNLVTDRFTLMHLDLNLLTVLEALVEEGSVTKAAARLRLSSPAVSRSLGRLRRLTGDEILVRTGRTMTRTPYALSVQNEVGDLLRRAQQVLAPSGPLDVGTLDRVFALRAHDALTAAIAPALMRDVITTAPGVRIRFLTETAHDTDDLRHGVIDLELGSAVPNASELRHELLGTDPLVAVLRRGHPAEAQLDAATYTALPHVIVSRRGLLADPVDQVLDGQRAQRRVVASVGTMAAAAQIVAGTDAVLTAPLLMVRTISMAFGLIARPVPLTLSAPDVVSVWHQRSDSDAAHEWLRDHVRAAVTALLEPDAFFPALG